MPNNDSGGVYVTTKDIYDKVQEISETLSDLKSSVEHVKDHESRIRALERWKYALPITAVTSIAAVFAGIFHIGG